MGVTRWQKALVWATREGAAPIFETTAGLFYGGLFEVDPELSALLPAGDGTIEERAGSSCR